MRRVVVSLMSGFALFGLLGLAGARVNTTASFPVGLYWQLHRSAGKGDLVLFCPPRERVFTTALARGYLSLGFCPVGTSALIKRVVAVDDDHVVIAQRGTTVNGVAVPHSRQRAVDSAGRPLPLLRLDTILSQGQVLLLSDQHAASFDGRYFGLVAATHLRGVVVPVWVFGREAAR
ncbi:conjugative transfer signal peptidase TraF [Methylotetracoccus oryzae]|uniref:conjugative transfer signal peptidase TraF n=1 Tax=Methylotetracoccus oryzae TaxID=1919059 RepID=UPI001119370E|nr:conjugative transfer signal peptidase TraF [Methylotetracoccus oryzae]